MSGSGKGNYGVEPPTLKGGVNRVNEKKGDRACFCYTGLRIWRNIVCLKPGEAEMG